MQLVAGGKPMGMNAHYSDSEINLLFSLKLRLRYFYLIPSDL